MVEETLDGVVIASRDQNNLAASPALPFPTEVFFDIGAGSGASYASDAAGHNSGENNKSAEDILAAFTACETGILQVFADDVTRRLAI